MDKRGFMLGQSNGKVYYLKRSGKVIPVTLQGWRNGGFRFVMKNGAVFRVRPRSLHRIIKEQQSCSTK